MRYSAAGQRFQTGAKPNLRHFRQTSRIKHDLVVQFTLSGDHPRSRRRSKGAVARFAAGAFSSSAQLNSRARGKRC